MKNKKSQSGFIGKYGLATVILLFSVVAIGQLIGVNNSSINGNYSSNLTSLFGVDNQQYSYNPTSLIEEFNNVTTISATSDEGGEFQEFKIGQKQSEASVSIFSATKGLIIALFDFSELALIKSLILGLLAIAIVTAGIGFIRRYPL